MYLIRIYDDGMIATAAANKGIDAFKKAGFVECDEATYQAAERYFDEMDGVEIPPRFEDWLKQQK